MPGPCYNMCPGIYHEATMIAPSDYNIFNRALEEAPTSTSTYIYYDDKTDTNTSSTTANEPLNTNTRCSAIGTAFCSAIIYDSLIHKAIADEVMELLKILKRTSNKFKNKPVHNRNHVPNRFCKNKDIKHPLLLNRKTLRCNRKGIGLRIRKGQ